MGTLKVTVSIPEPLFNMIEDAVEKYGYASRSAFICEACRQLLRELRREKV